MNKQDTSGREVTKSLHAILSDQTLNICELLISSQNLCDHEH
jgi:hypothetical protein